MAIARRRLERGAWWSWWMTVWPRGPPWKRRSLACRQAGAAGIVVAVPVGARATVAHLATLVDDVVCPATPVRFRAVGLAYADFSPVDDEEVVALLLALGIPL